MSQILIKNIKSLVQIDAQGTRNLLKGKEMGILPCMDNSFLLIQDGKIIDFGSMRNFTQGNFESPQSNDDTKPETRNPKPETIIDATGKFVFPSWCDSHTHLVFAGSREGEFVDRINGLTYEQIAQKGGGIIHSAEKLNETSEEELVRSATGRIEEIIRMGTGAVEIKSGYGLSFDGELKMLRVIKKLKGSAPIPIKATFLGAHAFPLEFHNNREGYLRHLMNRMLPVIAEEKLADYIDVFCETNYFSVPETERILEAGARYGLKPKIHVNQFSSIGGIKAGINHQALSVDHLEVMTDADFDALRGGGTISTLLPACSFFIQIPYPPARKLIETGVPVALASDYNPGSSPAGNMNFVISLACIKMRMTPEEAINAATLNGACAMELNREVGSIAIGKRANLFITKPMPSLAFLPYSFGANQIETVILNGKII